MTIKTTKVSVEELENQLQNAESLVQEEKEKTQREIYVKLSQAFLEEENYKNALQHAKKAVAVLTTGQFTAEEQAEAHYQLGKVKAEGDWAKAVQSFESVIALNTPVYTGKAYHQIGILYFHHQAWDQALENYQKAIQYHESVHHKEELGTSYNLIAALYAKTKKNKEALINFGTSIACHAAAKNYEGLAMTFQNMHLFLKEAMTVKNNFTYYQNKLTDAVENEDGGLAAFIYYYLGIRHYEEHETKQAISNLEKALELKKKHQIYEDIGDLYYYLGAAYEMHREHKKAIEYHVLALEKMLEYEQLSHTGLVVYFLHYSLSEMNPPALQEKAQTLLEEAKKIGFEVDEGGVQEESPSPLFDDTSLSANLSEVVQQGKAGLLNDLQDKYTACKSGLPKQPEEFYETACQLLELLQQNAKSSWLFKKKKRKAWEIQKEEIETILKDLSEKENQEGELQQKIQDWRSKVQNMSL